MVIHFFSGLKQKQFQLKCESKNRDRGWFPNELNPRLAVSHTHFLLNSFLSWNFTVITKFCIFCISIFLNYSLPFSFFFMSKTELKTQSLPSSKDGVACVCMIIVLQSYNSFSVCPPYYWNSLMYNVFN